MRAATAMRLLVAGVLMAVVVLPLLAQRRVTSVRNAQAVGVNQNRERQDSIAREGRMVHFHDENGNVVMVDTLTGEEVRDTSAMLAQGGIPRMIQPLIFSATAGVDVWDPLMRAFGQKYGLIEFSAELNLHNRYIPVVEVGLGQAKNRPDDANFTFRVPLTPYFRVGCNYNFLYNSNPDYMAYAGLRLGYSHFNYYLDDVTIAPGYWDQGETFNFPRQSCSVTYLQVLFGIRVRIAGPVSLGWNFRYKGKLHESKQPSGQPWYIPGFGSRSSHITGSFSIFYTFQLSPNLLPKKEPEKL